MVNKVLLKFSALFFPFISFVGRAIGRQEWTCFTMGFMSALVKHIWDSCWVLPVILSKLPRYKLAIHSFFDVQISPHVSLSLRFKVCLMWWYIKELHNMMMVRRLMQVEACKGSPRVLGETSFCKSRHRSSHSYFNTIASILWQKMVHRFFSLCRHSFIHGFLQHDTYVWVRVKGEDEENTRCFNCKHDVCL